MVSILTLYQRVQTGPIGTVYTNPLYRNRGFATSVAKIIFQKIGQSGFGATSCVKEMNLASRAIFEKIGCQNVGQVHWIAVADCVWTEQDDLEIHSTSSKSYTSKTE